MKLGLFFALQVVLLAMMGIWGPAYAQVPQQLTTHDGNQTSQHNSLSGQVTTHDTAQANQHNSLSGQVTTHDAAQTTHDTAQTNQHNSLSGQVTTHDSAQTSQHDELKGKIDNLGDYSGLPPTWDKILPADNPGGPCPSNSSRFTCVMGGAAVRDNETGLVWEQSPSITGGGFKLDEFKNGSRNWQDAQIHCNRLTVGNRMGWRLPTLQELASLIDRSQSGLTLPAGHPLNKDNVQSSFYWSATTFARDASNAWVVHFGNGGVGGVDKGDVNFVWCVRGGQGVDPQ